jgi:hypothetical protein
VVILMALSPKESFSHFKFHAIAYLCSNKKPIAK